MSEKSQTATSSGIGLAGAVFIVFLTMKLLDKIDWSWVWVTAPLWMPTALVVAILLAVVVVALPLHLWSGYARARVIRKLRNIERERRLKVTP